ncbi:MAG: HK97 gp10 family phage protein [Clostridiales bacterium]|jgi:HK97 gp10 family phage protein|nr:HK97 gp10 family phage protein [Clostridiales bacterium]
MAAKVEIKGLNELDKSLDKILSKKERIKREVLFTALDIQSKAKKKLREQKAIDEGYLKNSIVVDTIRGGLAAEIGSIAPYAPYVEFGTKPHFPPPDALEDWARRHGFDSAWPICKVIAKRGLKERPYLSPAYEEEKDGFVQRIKKILESEE